MGSTPTKATVPQAARFGEEGSGPVFGAYLSTSNGRSSVTAALRRNTTIWNPATGDRRAILTGSGAPHTCAALHADAEAEPPEATFLFC